MKKKNIIIGLITGALLTVSLAGCGKIQDDFPITKAKAKEIAITQLGVESDAASYAIVTKAGTKQEPHYVVEVLLEGVVYEYKIDPQSGNIQKLTVNDQTVAANELPPPPSADSSGYIGVEAAKEIAFTEAGTDKDSVQKLDFELDFAYGAYLYDIEFTANGHKYEYEIHAVTGEVFKKSVDRVTVIAPTVENTDFISTEEAKEIALAHAGVQKETARFDGVEWELKKGSPVYEIEFKADGVEYEYDIHAQTGKIIQSRTEGKQQNGESTADPDHITVEEAKAIALSHAGVSTEEARFEETDLDFDHGKEVFEISFEVGRTEYEYEIDAHTGKILHVEKDIDD